ncbi:MAG: trifunctional transcriptional activator/DNA repair protein Ada/methylated-DNA--[protein]-cysteine S-methyltransferase [Chthoniobacterales bacterium]|nr:trifunctional transcriptional activator/DNA repair protein Ada/methylated-DNA--[protein]-cysteine S-methyltransferase [Chthoniobacterales bacterium]
MFTEKLQQKYYQALLDKNKEYDGIFYVGVTTTGVFCRPTCPARKPKQEHCEFFKTAQEALLASFRPCRRCQPLSHPDHVSDLVKKLVEAVEAHPEKRWKDRDFVALSVDPSTARRQFKKRFGMTFVAYARARRMGLAMKEIRKGGAVIQAQLSAGYESSSGFRDAFSKIMGAAPTKPHEQHCLLKVAWLDSPLGPMLAVADEKELYLLEFVERRGLEREIERLRLRLKAAIVPGMTEPLRSIDRELKSYFEGKLKEFETPLFLLGSDFQKKVWQALLKIPYGETRSYAAQALSIGEPKATRAVANANGANQLAIVIPCHRIINSSGALGGYGGGIARKEWLLQHEAKYQHEHTPSL